MVLSEEEAKNKRCQEGFAAAYGLSEDGKQQGPIASMGMQAPMSYAAGAAYAVYSQPHGGAPFNCLGSACMAWRWKGWSRAPGDDFSFTIDNPTADHPDYLHYGFCGKAGRP